MKIHEGNYILGLRLGVASLGWAALTTDAAAKPVAILAMGARKFPIGASGDVASGRETSNNQRRQDASSTRTRLARRSARLRAIWKLLHGVGLLPCDFNVRGKWVESVDRGDVRRPYRLRAKALDAALSKEELGRALFHLAHRRGFQSNRRDLAKGNDEELGIVKKGILELEQRMLDSGARTLGEFFSKLDERVAIRRRWTARSMIAKEFDLVTAAQAVFHPELSAGFVATLRQAIFFQRPLKSQSGRIGRCELEPHRQRCLLGHLDAQEFRVLCRVNDLRLVDDIGAKEVELSGEQRQKLLRLLESGDASFAAVRKSLGLSKSIRFNAERIDDEKLVGFRTLGKIQKALGRELSYEDTVQVVDALLTIDDDAGLRRRLIHLHLSQEDAEKLSRVVLEPSYARLSRKAIAALLPALRNGVAYATARKDLYPQADHHEEVARLPLVHVAYPQLTNPLVRRAVGEMRTVVNAIVKKYGRPQEIRISLLRELRVGRKARERAWFLMRQRAKARAAVAKRICEDVGMQEPPPWAIDKVLLAEECGWTCPFTGKVFSIRSLLGVGQETQFEIVHIVPLHQSLDDAFENKTLCHVSAIAEVKAMRRKDEKVFARFEKMTGPLAREKLRRIKLSIEQIVEEFSEEAIASRFVDSCHASVVAADFLSKLYPSNRRAVQPARNSVVSYVREGCGIGRITIPHGSHKRYAIEAVTVALCASTTTRRLSAAARDALPGRRRFHPSDLTPWPRFGEDLAAAAATVVVGARVRRKVSGALHEETLYRHHGEMDGKKVFSVRKHLWQLTASDVALIMSDTTRGLVAGKLVELGESEPRKAFAKVENLPVWQGVAIRAVRIKRIGDMFAIGEKSAKRYVATERNHHVLVHMRRGKGGKDTADKVVVSQFEAQRRLVKGEPVVQRGELQRCNGMLTLAVQETVEIASKLYTVRSVGVDPGIVLTDIDDGRTLAEIAVEKARLRISVEQMRQRGARKVVVTPLGEIRSDNS